MTEPLLSYGGVAKSFGSLRVLDSVDLQVFAGEFVAVLGPSGCGKSTLLNMAAGIMPVSNGTVQWRGGSVDGPNREVGYITQNDLLLPWRTVHDNIALPLQIRRVPKSDRVERVGRIIDEMSLTGFERSFPSQLSGGMRKRVSIGRTLAYAPEAIFMDEPFASLDAQLRLRMQEMVRELHTTTGVTFVFVTHDIAEAIALADRVVVISRRPGRVVHQEDIHLDDRSFGALQSSSGYTKHFQSLWNVLDSQVG